MQHTSRELGSFLRLSPKYVGTAIRNEALPVNHVSTHPKSFPVKVTIYPCMMQVIKVSDFLSLYCRRARICVLLSPPPPPECLRCSRVLTWEVTGHTGKQPG